MKIIITENQLKNKVHQMIKELGWKDTCETMGLSGKDLIELFFDNNPMEYLNMYNDLDVVQSEHHTLFRYEKGNNLMVYDKRNEIVYINYDNIWSVLRKDFGLNYDETQEFTQRWLSEVYNLRGVTTLENEYLRSI